MTYSPEENPSPVLRKYQTRKNWGQKTRTMLIETKTIQLTIMLTCTSFTIATVTLRSRGRKKIKLNHVVKKNCVFFCCTFCIGAKKFDADILLSVGIFWVITRCILYIIV